MQITDILARTGGLASIARELGLSEAQVRSGAAALAPAILGGFKKQANAMPTGLDGLGGLLGQLGGGGLLESVLAAAPTPVARGNDVLGQIFGSKQVSRTVAEDAAAKTGLDVGVLKQMLPMLAMLVAGFLAKQKESGASGSPAPAGGALGDLLGGLLGGGAKGGNAGLASILDLDGDGNPLDDLLGMAGKAFR